MTSFGWWAQHAGPGNFMCTLCFESRPVDQAWVDGDGQAWNMCLECKAWEDEALRRKEENGG